MTLAAQLTDALVRRVFPGGVLLWGDGADVRGAQSFGHLDTDVASPATPDPAATLYDLASLTKPLGTTTLIAQEVAAGRLELEARLDSVWPAATARPSGAATVRQLLAHTSGLPDWRPFHETLRARGLALPSRTSRTALLDLVLAEPLEARPGERYRYSDLDFILLGRLLEHLTDRPLAQLLAERVLNAAGAGAARTFDLLDPEPSPVLPGTVAPTERCPWRGKELVAEVHDDNAWAAGGVEGHAGLFATAQATYQLARPWLAGLAGHGPLAAVAARFLPPPPAPALGWDRPAAEGAQGGRHLGPQACGHLGFTGTSVWIDPEQERIVVLLTNRVHPDRTDRGIAEARRRIHDALHAELARSMGPGGTP